MGRCQVLAVCLSVCLSVCRDVYVSLCLCVALANDHVMLHYVDGGRAH